MRRSTSTVISALPGYDLVEAITVGITEWPNRLSYRPIVAWVVVIDFDDRNDLESSTARPVCIDDVFHNLPNHFYGIRQPDGVIEFPGQATFEKDDEQERDVLAHLVGCMKDYQDRAMLEKQRQKIAKAATQR